jgi:hyperosmotically inducible periplasmic protein
MNKSVFALLLSTLLASSFAFSQTPAPVAPDNAKSNKVDATNTAATADSQSNASSDMDVTQRIRQSVMADKSLSTYAHNVKIITTNGSVTLNGVVKTQAEKSAIEMKAASIVGKGKVTNDLKVAAASGA